MSMLALTVRQPGAACIAHLSKRTDNRSRRLPDRYIGAPLAIHAAAALEPEQVLYMPPGSGFETLFASTGEWDAWRWWHLGRKPRDEAHWPPKLALAAVVAVATPAGCHRWDWENLCGPQHADTSPSTPGLCSPWVRIGAPWHWELADVHPLPQPVACRGWRGLWPLPEDIEKSVRAQLDTAYRCHG